MTKDKIDFDDLQYGLARSRQLSQGDRLNVMESLSTFAQRLRVLMDEVKTLFVIFPNSSKLCITLDHKIN